MHKSVQQQIYSIIKQHITNNNTNTNNTNNTNNSSYKDIINNDSDNDSAIFYNEGCVNVVLSDMLSNTTGN